MTRLQRTLTVLLTTVGVAATLMACGRSEPPPPAPATTARSEAAPGADYQRARFDPIHFKPAIEKATDAQCLACHKEVLEPSVRKESPAGVKAANASAWYQTLATYEGEQDTFHRRHIETPLAKRLMKLGCTTCHEGNDPREEAQGSSATGAHQDDPGFSLRKMVNPETTCLKCHGPMNWQLMGLPEPWAKSSAMFQDNCLTCHAAIRTVRHQVSYLNTAAIEEDGAKNSDTCYGCHGGRAWYRIGYPYPRHAWPGMAPETPDWAKSRPTTSEPRFALPIAVTAAAAVQTAQAGGPAPLKTASDVDSRIAPVARVEFAATTAAAGPGDAVTDGKKIYDASCMACHATGAANAPRTGDTSAWEPRIKAGTDALVKSVMAGKGAMPPKGGNPALTDAGAAAAVQYLLSQGK